VKPDKNYSMIFYIVWFYQISFLADFCRLKKLSFAIGAMPKLEIWKNGNRHDAETRKFKKTAIGAMPNKEIWKTQQSAQRRSKKIVKDGIRHNAEAEKL